MGLQPTAEEMDNIVRLDIPFVFRDSTGNVSALGPQIVSDIDAELSGKFGDRGRTFQTNAHITDASVGSSYVTVDRSVGTSVTKWDTGTWHLGELFPGASSRYIASHETLHLLGLKDLYVPGAHGGYKPGPDGKPMALPGVDSNNFMVGRGGTSLTDDQVDTIVRSNSPNSAGRFWRSVAHAMKQDSGRLGPENPGAFYNGTIYASDSQAAAVMAWDRMYRLNPSGLSN